MFDRRGLQRLNREGGPVGGSRNHYQRVYLYMSSLFGVLRCSALVTLCFAVTAATYAGGGVVRPSLCGWDLIATASPMPGSAFWAIGASSTSDIWAVGSQNGSSATLTEHFDGTSWSLVQSPNTQSTTNFLTGVATLGSSDAWAVGEAAGGQSIQTLAEHWNGTAWTIVGTPNPGQDQWFDAVAMVATNDVWAVGQTCATGDCWALVAHFNGRRWATNLMTDRGISPVFRAISADAPNDVWAVGDTQAPSSGRHLGLVEHWDGTRWTRIPTPSSRATVRLQAVKADSPTDVWVAGSSGNTTIHAFFEHWNGSQWAVVRNPAGFGTTSQINALAGSAANDLWAVGSLDNSVSLLTEHWDGSAWVLVPAPLPGGGAGGFFGAIDFGPNNALAVGYTGNVTLAEAYCVPSGSGDPTFHEYSIPPTNGHAASPQEVAVAPDGSAWFTDQNNDEVAHITAGGTITEIPFSTNVKPLGITLGPDGNMWVAEQQGGHIAQVTATGTVTQFSISGCAQSIVAGSDGALWFNECLKSQLGRITTSGIFSTVKIPFQARYLAASPDGSIWFTGTVSQSVGRFSIATGTTTLYSFGHSVGLTGIAVAPDDSAWAGEIGGAIARIGSDGTITEYPEPNMIGEPKELTLGGDGNVWFANGLGGEIGSIAPDGTYTIYFPRHGGDGLGGIAGKPGVNAIWFAEPLFSRIGRLNDIL